MNTRRQYKILLHVQEEDKTWLQKLGLVNFEAFMSSDIGDLVQREDTCEVRRISGHGRVAYLKRRCSSLRRTSLEMYLTGLVAHCAPYNEFLHVRALQAKKLPVMQIIAAGESRRFGLPEQGFILSQGVSGDTLDYYFNQAAQEGDEQRQECLLAAYGKLLGQLHQQGFFAPLRLKDIFAVDEDLANLTMIDREARHPYPRMRFKWLAKKALGTSFRRNARTSKYFGEEQVNRVLKAYGAE